MGKTRVAIFSANWLCQIWQFLPIFDKQPNHLWQTQLFIDKSNIEITCFLFYVSFSSEIYVIVTYLHRENLKNVQMKKKNYSWQKKYANPGNPGFAHRLNSDLSL